jgi:hypothetical protein
MNRNKVIALVAFSIAMAALEGAVVVYLRALYYPNGFTVAFKLIDQHIILVELLREIATLVMLGAVGYLAGKDLNSRFASFLIAFAVWDIWYYIWLKLFIGWPGSLLDWDILFLIPWTWLGPVLAPVVCSLTMIVLAFMLVRNTTVQWTRIDVVLLLAGIATILYTFLSDYGSIILGNNLMSEYASLLTNKQFVSIASSYVPKSYNWFLFTVGEAFFVILIYRMYRRSTSPSITSQLTTLGT